MSLAETVPEPVGADLLAADRTTVLAWADARAQLAEAATLWLATIHPGGRPHVRPVLAVVADGRLYTTSSGRARKARNAVRDPRCSLTASTAGLDVVVEGALRLVGDEAELHRVAGAYLERYGWPATVTDGAFDAPYGAPTAGPPPYQVYEVRPARAYGFGTDDETAPRTTRWTFVEERR